MSPHRYLFLLLMGVLLLPLSCRDRPGSTEEVPEEEVVSEVRELDAFHEVMAPMWHQAYPARDIPAIQAAVPEFEPLLSALGDAVLPGILRHKEPDWETGYARLMEAFQSLKTATEEGDEDGILAGAETFHMSYEAMVRVIRPVVPELNAFHRHLYGVYHYYGPTYDLDRILQAADEMGEALPPLVAAALPERLAHRQQDFDLAVQELSGKVAVLLMALENPDRWEVEAAIEEVHTAYQAVEAIFDRG